MITRWTVYYSPYAGPEDSVRTFDTKVEAQWCAMERASSAEIWEAAWPERMNGEHRSVSHSELPSYLRESSLLEDALDGLAVDYEKLKGRTPPMSHEAWVALPEAHRDQWIAAVLESFQHVGDDTIKIIPEYGSAPLTLEQRLVDKFPGLRDGETDVNGGDLVDWLTQVLREET
jgi:hypothetical protein